MSFQCPSCGGSVPVPNDLAIVTATCPYCRTSFDLPNQEARQQAFEREREREHALQTATEQRRRVEASKTRTRHIALAIVGVGLLVLGGGAIGIVMLVKDATKVADPTLAGLPKMTAKIDQRTKQGCTRVVSAPEPILGAVASTYHLTNASCFEVLALTAVPGEALTMTVTGPNGALLPGVPPPGSDLAFRTCPKTPGEYVLRVLPKDAQNPFTVAALDCPKPSLDDPNANGQARVSTIMKERYAAGCKEVTLPPRTVAVDQDFTGDFKVGSCILVIASTGAPKNLLAFDMTTPFGEKVATPAPAAEIAFSFCPKVAGPHEGHVRAAEGGPFTLAAVTCPKAK